ncbi:MAG TPA: hypothetical protein VG099_26430 [Gemmataceae bacterium]|jgi:hypothetical protein|nr:hypothetical protein [Gemmataceae bacterium]
MKTKIGLIVCAVAVAAAGWVVLSAAAQDLPRTTGRVLVLSNEQTIEGAIERQGDQYRVRRPVGEVWVQQEQVLRLCQDHGEAYQFLRSRANLRDPDEHVRLSNWCQAHGLKKEAMDEASTVAQMRPNDAASIGLLKNLERAQRMHQTAQETKPHQEPESPPPVDTNSLSIFVTRVQPILMNACANCHATGRGGAFRLSRTYEHGWNSRKTTLQNLSAVLARVDVEQPQASLFLTKAVSIHGAMSQPALKDRDIPAFRALEEWVRTTIESNPHLAQKAHALSQATARSSVEASPLPGADDADKKPKAKPAPPPLDRKEPGDPPGRTEALPQARTNNVDADPVDTFDPVIFNRQMHPLPNQEGGNK